jgi:hypothetical protein
MAFVGMGTLATRAGAGTAAADFVKYYEVAESYAGEPENLPEIARRFLADSTRANEIFYLNVGRTQPDGASLTDANSLHMGWLLVLPWDALGDGVRVGALPTTPPSSAVTSNKPPAASTPFPSTTPAPAPAPSSVEPSATSQSCTSAQTSSREANTWAQERLAPQQAWSRSRGDGVIVAVVDSGVDGRLPELAGRVAAGADVITGSSNGNVDCIGSGTAMAALIAAQAESAISGVAPSATILPIRVVADKASAEVAHQALAIDIAVSAGATVIALGSFVDVSQPEVMRAIEDAASHDVVLLAGASVDGITTVPHLVIRVGAIDFAGHLAQPYARGGVDVVAPGVDVTSLGISGTGIFRGSGTQYAVALVAGEAALLRGLDRMSAADVVHQITRSARPMDSEQVPNPESGWGLIDPSKAVGMWAGPPASAIPPQSDRTTTFPTTALVLASMVALGVVGLLLHRMGRAFASRRQDALDVSEPEPDQSDWLGPRSRDWDGGVIPPPRPGSWSEADAGLARSRSGHDVGPRGQ